MLNIIQISEADSSISRVEKKLLIELRTLLEAEWGTFAPFGIEQDGVKTPPALVALRGETLVGGLVFSLWENPESKDLSVWINGVIVKPEFRRTGAASQLISAAQQLNIPLLVKAEIKSLYSKLGWKLVSEIEGDFILKYL